MSALGDYVYLKSTNYFNKDKKDVFKKIHYEDGIFKKHKDSIIKKIKAVKVRDLEQDYNRILKETYDTWKDLAANATETERLDFFKTVLANNELISKATNLDDIVGDLSFDEERDTIVYAPEEKTRLDTKIKVKKLRGTQYSFLSTLQ